MARRAARIPVVLAVALALLMPTFWMSDIAQANAASPVAGELSAPAGEQPAASTPVSDAGSPEHDEANAAVDMSIPVGNSGGGMGKGFSGLGAAIVGQDPLLPQLARGEASLSGEHRIPPGPFLEVPTTPPLHAA